jgi:hypothetical protein
MCGEKRQQIIDSILKLTDKEADILAVFLAGLKAGKQTREKEMTKPMGCAPEEKTA